MKECQQMQPTEESPRNRQQNDPMHFKTNIFKTLRRRRNKYQRLEWDIIRGKKKSEGYEKTV